MADSVDTPPAAGTQAERSPRQSVFLSATLERFGSNVSTRHRVRDLSQGGMRIDQATGLQVGATVLVTIGMLEAVAAAIMWVKDGWAGVKFAVAVDPDQARGKAAVTPKTVTATRRDAAATVPTAGWIGNLDSPYRK